MLKLVICDVDGTLLPAGQTRLSDGVVQGLSALVKTGARVVLASGRSLHGIKALTAGLPFEEALCYIADDGALCLADGKVLYHKQIAEREIAAFAGEKAYAGCPKLFFAGSFSYALDADEAFLADVRRENLDEVRPISKLYEMREPVFKLGVRSPDGKSEPPAFSFLPGTLREAYQNGAWREYTPANADKGTALAALQAVFYVTAGETAALGDGYNDRVVFAKAAYTFARRTGDKLLADSAYALFDDAADVLKRLCGMQREAKED